jgi:beta-galactosidase
MTKPLRFTPITFALLAATAGLMLLPGTVGAADRLERTRDSFDHDWLFARFGPQPDGTVVPEPGGATRTIELSASTEENAEGRNHPAAEAMDGDPATRWCASDGKPNQWLALKFRTAQKVGTLKINWDVTGAWKEPGLPYRFVVETSADGAAWTEVADFTKTAAAANPVDVKLSGAPVRFLRIRTTAVEGTQWASIREIELADDRGQPIKNTLLPAEPGPEAVAFADTSWRKLNVPHDWGIEGPFRLELAGETGKLPWKAIGWYRKHFEIPAADKGRRIFVDFDGAMANAKVYCNGQFVGTWPYGYSSFRLELTPFLKFGAANTLAVRLDTTQWDSRWYPGGGLYRHVWLVKTAPTHVAHWGTYVTTPEVSAEKAVAHIAVTVDNQAAAPARAVVQTDVYEMTNETLGKKVASSEPVTLELASNASGIATNQATVLSPKLWSLEATHRYIARTTVSIAGNAVDTYDTPFGFRTLQFTARDGFLLNGKRVEIRGTCNHHDLGALGAALNGRALERQLQILKDMGCNALRTSHNPPAPELLELADRMGFLVWDEAFDCWARGKKALDYNRLFKDWHVKDLQALVHRDRNHPSVFIWSIGNEVMEQRDVTLTKHLADVVRAEDPTRPVSNGYNDPDGGRASGAVVGLDLMGVNYFFGQQDKWDHDPRYQDKPTIGSETSSCVSSRGEYFFGTNRKEWQITSYDADRPGWGCDPDTQFRTFAHWPHLLGEFVWTGFDYLGEPTPYGSGDNTQLLNFRNDPAKREQLEKEMAELAKHAPPSRSSYFGIVDLAGFPKDRFYSYQAQWRPELPMAHLFPHWNWPERVGQKVPVHLYTSGDSAELFLNGQSLGKKTKRPGQDFRLVWDDVIYQPGELKAVAYKDGKEWATDVVKTTGPAAKLALQADRPAIKANGADLSFITLRIADAAGLTVPRTHNLVKFSVTGPGEIVATDNGNPISFESFQSLERKAFNGLALVIVRAKPGQSGTFTVKAESEGLTPATAVIQAK